MKASELFVQCLENEKIDYIFGIPGEENIAVMDALRKFRRTRNLPLILMLSLMWYRPTARHTVPPPAATT